MEIDFDEIVELDAITLVVGKFTHGCKLQWTFVLYKTTHETWKIVVQTPNPPPEINRSVIGTIYIENLEYTANTIVGENFFSVSEIDHMMKVLQWALGLIKQKQSPPKDYYIIRV